jgi:prolyl-tRNA synthetase
MHAAVLDEQGKSQTMFMGCYGIGSRGSWRRRSNRTTTPTALYGEAIAPFQVVLVPINYQKSTRVQQTADALYQQFKDAGIDVLLDDRDTRPGVKFADSELMGIPHRIVIGDRGLDAGNLEYRHRRATESTEIPAADPVGYIRHKLNG